MLAMAEDCSKTLCARPILEPKDGCILTIIDSLSKTSPLTGGRVWVGGKVAKARLFLSAIAVVYSRVFMMFELNKCTQVECPHEGEKWAFYQVFRAIRYRPLTDFGGLV